MLDRELLRCNWRKVIKVKGWHCLVRMDWFASLEDSLCKSFLSRASVSFIEFNSKITVLTARVVASCEKNATDTGSLLALLRWVKVPDKAWNCGRWDGTVFTDHYFANLVSCSDFDDNFDSYVIVKAAISWNDEYLAFLRTVQNGENWLHEVLQVVLLLNNGNFFA